MKKIVMCVTSSAPKSRVPTLVIINGVHMLLRSHLHQTGLGAESWVALHLLLKISRNRLTNLSNSNLVS